MHTISPEDHWPVVIWLDPPDFLFVLFNLQPKVHMENKTYYILTTDGIFKRTESNQLVCVSTQMLTDMLPKISTTIALLTDPTEQHGPLSMAINKDLINFYARLHWIGIDSWWIADTEGALTPTFQTNKGQRLAVKWTPPSSMVVALLCQFALVTREFSGCYMVAINKDGQMFRLPFSNTYDNSGICLQVGGGVVVKNKTLAGRYEEILTTLNQNPWAGDLLKATDVANAAKIVRVSTDGKTLSPSVRDWTKHCNPVSFEYVNLIDTKLL